MNSTVAVASDRRGSVLASTITTIAVSALFVFTRVVSRLIILRRLGWDDCMSVLAWVMALGLSLSLCYGTTKGIGLSLVTTMHPEWLPGLRKSMYTFDVLYNPAWMITKISILAFYLRAFHPDRTAMLASVTILVVVCCSGIALSFLNLFQCRPVTAGWRAASLDRSHMCIDVVVLYLSSAPVNLITDIAIFLVPFRITTRLRLPHRQKAILVITFALGAFVIAIGVMRIAYLEETVLTKLRNNDLFRNNERVRVTSDKNMSYDVSLSYMWSAVEVNVGIICACLPSLKLFVARIFPSILGRSNDVGDGRKIRNLPVFQLLRMNPSHMSSCPSRTGMSRSSDEVVAATIRIQNVGNMPPPVQLAVRDIEHEEESITNANLFHAQQSTSAGTQTTLYGSSASFALLGQQEFQSLVGLTAKQSYLHIAIVTVLFLLSGIVYAWITALNSYVQKISHAPFARTIQLQVAYYAGWFGPLCISQFVLRKFGFKMTMITGLSITACGCVVFWPSAVLLSTPGFIISNFIMGLGVATVELAANTFLMLCGPAKYAEIRFLFSSVIARTGGVISAIVAQKVLLSGVADATALVNTQWAYLAMAFFVLFLAVLISYMRLPEVTDEELDNDAAYIIGERQVLTLPYGIEYVCKWDVVHTTFALGIISMICFQGAQGVVDFFFTSYIKSTAENSRLSAVYIGWIGRAAVVASRFIALIACIFVSPSLLLLCFYAALAVVSILSLTVEGNTGIAIMVLIRFFGGPVWPLLYVTTLKGMGRSTKLAAAGAIATVGAGGIFPVLTYLVQKHTPTANPVRNSFWIMAAFSCIGLVMPVFINFSRAARKQTNRR